MPSRLSIYFLCMCLVLSGCRKGVDTGSYIPVSEETAACEDEEDIRRLRELYESSITANDDTVGALMIPGTPLFLPVMKASLEPLKYLRADIEGNYSVRGTPFIISGDLVREDAVICGHYYSSGEVFGTVHLYIDDPHFIASHPRLLIVTREGVSSYRILGAVMMESEELEEAVQGKGNGLREMFGAGDEVSQAVYLVTCMDYASSGRRRVLCAVK